MAMTENSKAVARIQLFQRKCQEAYTEMLERGLCEEGDEFIMMGGPTFIPDYERDTATWPNASNGEAWFNGVRTYAHKDDPKILVGSRPGDPLYG